MQAHPRRTHAMPWTPVVAAAGLLALGTAFAQTAEKPATPVAQTVPVPATPAAQMAPAPATQALQTAPTVRIPTLAGGARVAIDKTNLRPRGYFQRIAAGETIKIALNNGTPPYCLRGPDGTPHGFDIALAEELAKALKMKVEYVYPKTSEQVEWLRGGKSDIAVAGLTVTIERARHVNFTRPYLEITQGALLDRRRVPREVTEGLVREVPIASYFDLKKIPGLVVGAKEGTRVEELARENFPNATVEAYPSALDAVRALRDRKIDAVVHDAPLIEFIHHFQRWDMRHIRAITGPSTREHIAIAVRRGDADFLEFLNLFLTQLENDGQLRRWRETYIDSARWAEDLQWEPLASH